MHLFPVKFTCLSCGYGGLEHRPYVNSPLDLREIDAFHPPYAQAWGEASYEVCSCCGYEFGFEDEPGTAAGVTFEAHLTQSIAQGCIWFSPDLKPADWQLAQQLANLHKKLRDDGSLEQWPR